MVMVAPAAALAHALVLILVGHVVLSGGGAQASHPAEVTTGSTIAEPFRVSQDFILQKRDDIRGLECKLEFSSAQGLLQVYERTRCEDGSCTCDNEQHVSLAWSSAFDLPLGGATNASQPAPGDNAHYNLSLANQSLVASYPSGQELWRIGPNVSSLAPARNVYIRVLATCVASCQCSCEMQLRYRPPSDAVIYSTLSGYAPSGFTASPVSPTSPTVVTERPTPAPQPTLAPTRRPTRSPSRSPTGRPTEATGVLEGVADSNTTVNIFGSVLHETRFAPGMDVNMFVQDTLVGTRCLLMFRSDIGRISVYSSMRCLEGAPSPGECKCFSDQPSSTGLDLGGLAAVPGPYQLALEANGDLVMYGENHTEAWIVKSPHGYPTYLSIDDSCMGCDCSCSLRIARVLDDVVTFSLGGGAGNVATPNPNTGTVFPTSSPTVPPTPPSEANYSEPAFEPRFPLSIQDIKVNHTFWQQGIEYPFHARLHAAHFRLSPSNGYPPFVSADALAHPESLQDCRNFGIKAIPVAFANATEFRVGHVVNLDTMEKYHRFPFTLARKVVDQDNRERKYFVSDVVLMAPQGGQLPPVSLDLAGIRFEDKLRFSVGFDVQHVHTLLPPRLRANFPPRAPTMATVFEVEVSTVWHIAHIAKEQMASVSKPVEAAKAVPGLKALVGTYEVLPGELMGNGSAPNAVVVGKYEGVGVRVRFSVGKVLPADQQDALRSHIQDFVTTADESGNAHAGYGGHAAGDHGRPVHFRLTPSWWLHVRRHHALANIHAHPRDNAKLRKQRPRVVHPPVCFRCPAVPRVGWPRGQRDRFPARLAHSGNSRDTRIVRI